jgi:hypothetical protein
MLLFYLPWPAAVGLGGNWHMLETLIVVLVILWLLGMVSSYTLGGFIHILLVVAIVVLLLRVIQGRRVV